MKVTEDGKKALIDLAQGDMRKVLNILQSSATAFPEVNEDSVYTCVGHPLKSDIMNILKWLLNDDFSTTFKSKFLSLKYNQSICTIIIVLLFYRNSRHKNSKRISSSRHINRTAYLFVQTYVLFI